jgi:hypothetical protein
MVHVSDGSDPVYMTASGCTKTRRLGGSPDLVLGKGCKMTMAIPLVRTRLIENDYYSSVILTFGVSSHC